MLSTQFSLAPDLFYSKQYFQATYHFSFSESNSDNELDSKHTFSSSNKRSDGPLIVDLTNEEEQINSNDNSEDSDYKMALMLSQEELKSVNEEAKNRKDRERLDFQMALLCLVPKISHF